MWFSAAEYISYLRMGAAVTVDRTTECYKDVAAGTFLFSTIRLQLSSGTADRIDVFDARARHDTITVDWSAHIIFTAPRDRGL